MLLPGVPWMMGELTLVPEIECDGVLFYLLQDYGEISLI